MKEFIDAFNVMLEANVCMNNGRVTVDYCKNANMIFIKCRKKIETKTETIDCSQYTLYGLWWKICKVIDELYN